MRISFYGAAGEVTGSCTLVEAGGVRFLVDCGMFQGGPEARTKNVRALNFGFDVRGLDFVLLTHAHPDHMCGLLDAQGKAAFPKATVWLSKADATYWLDPASEEYFPYNNETKAMLTATWSISGGTEEIMKELAARQWRI